MIKFSSAESFTEKTRSFLGGPLCMFSELRGGTENVERLKSITGVGKIPRGTLPSGSEAIKSTISTFGLAKRADLARFLKNTTIMEKAGKRPKNKQTSEVV
jgi:hypothetical protein